MQYFENIHVAPFYKGSLLSKPIGGDVLSAISTLGTVWRDCVAEGLRLIFIPVGVEDDEEPKDRASETRDDGV